MRRHSDSSEMISRSVLRVSFFRAAKKKREKNKNGLLFRAIVGQIGNLRIQRETSESFLVSAGQTGATKGNDCGEREDVFIIPPASNPFRVFFYS